MDKVAALKPGQRSQLFQETASQRGMSAAVVEKDFWVCWVLKQIFSDPQLQTRLVFKGGTSLSRVFGLIERFSEDIDLILDWRLLGYGPGQQDPYANQPSNTRQDYFNAEFNERAAQYIAETLSPQLGKLFRRCPQVRVAVDPNEPQVVNVEYPAAFSLDYLRPQVRLEIGPLASFVPPWLPPYPALCGTVFPESLHRPGRSRCRHRRRTNLLGKGHDSASTGAPHQRDAAQALPALLRHVSPGRQQGQTEGLG